MCSSRSLQKKGIIFVAAALLLLVGRCDESSEPKQPIPSSSTTAVIELTTDNFDSLTSKGIWLVKFVAPWCTHCKTLTPEFRLAALQASEDSILRDYQFGSLDITEHDEIRSRYKIFSFPTVSVFADGELAKDVSNLRSSVAFLRFLKFLDAHRREIRQRPSLTLDAVRASLTDPVIMASPVERPKPASAVVLQCHDAQEDSSCFAARELFIAASLRFFDLHRFVESTVATQSSTGGPTVTIVVFNGPSKQLAWPFTAETLMDFLEAERWPPVTALDMIRLASFKKSAMRRTGGIVTLALETRKNSHQQHLPWLINAQQTSKFQNEFLFGWVDVSRSFRQSIGDLGVLSFPRVIVFGGRRVRDVWLDPREVNMTVLDAGLGGILDGSIAPMRHVDMRKKMMASANAIMQDLGDFSFASIWNFLMVVGLTIVGILLLFVVCHFWVLNLHEDAPVEAKLTTAEQEADKENKALPIESKKDK